MKPSEYFFSFVLFMGLVFFLISLNSCGSMQLKSDPKLMSKVDLRDAGVEKIVGIETSSGAHSQLELYGVQVNSPTIIVKAFENVTKIDITLYRNDSKSNWVNYITLVLLLLVFVVLVIHLRRIK